VNAVLGRKRTGARRPCARGTAAKQPKMNGNRHDRPRMPDLDQLLDPRIEVAPMRKSIARQAVSTVHSRNGMGDAAGSGRYVRRGEDRVR
jgi:hypothetical protein